MEDKDHVLELWRILGRFAQYRLEVPSRVAHDELGAGSLFDPAVLVASHCERAGLPDLSVLLVEEPPQDFPGRAEIVEAVYAMDWLAAPAPALAELAGDLFITAGVNLSEPTRRWLAGREGTPMGTSLVRAILDLQMLRPDQARVRLRHLEGLAQRAGDTAGRALALLWIGQTYADAGRDEEALAAFRSGAQLGAEAGDPALRCAVFTETARLLFRAGRHEDAAEACSEALRLSPDDEYLRLLRAQAWWFASRPELAVFDLEAVAGAEPGPAFLSEAGQCLAEAGEGARAVAALERALADAEIEPLTAAYALNGLGLAHTVLGDPVAALRAFAASEATCPENAWLFFNRGRFHDRFGTREEALVAYRRSLEAQDPPLPPAKRQAAEVRVAELRER